METIELLWFTMGVSGFVVFLEGAVTFLVEKIFKGKLPFEVISLRCG